jgi:hypothetical protein
MLLLGTFLFEDFEIPESVKGLLSGKQMLSVKKQIGGQRVIDAMGPDPADVTWAGRFQGGDLVARASFIAVMRDAGQPVVMVCDEVVLTVVIHEFNVGYERPYQGLYDIRLVVQDDLTLDLIEALVAPLDDLVNNDLTSAANILGGAVTGGISSL